MLVKLLTAAVKGLQATIVQVEVHAVKGDKFYLVGLPDSSIRESHDRMIAAIQNSGYHYSTQSYTINLAPADLRKEGTGYDLPLAIGVMASSGFVKTDLTDRYLMVGELGLDGSLRPIKGALPIAIKARTEGYEGLIVPKANVREAAVVDTLKVYGAEHLQEVVDFLNGKENSLHPTIIDTRAEFYRKQTLFQYDFSDVKGQENVKRALEVAAAGGHNIILVGSPGCGKSMMAKRLPGILPPLSLRESLETTQIHSVAGKLDKETSLITSRPFRSPHHTISDIALIGGGVNFQPGEISLAHNGVLFLDELPEFSKSALETLRQPLEDRRITISRAKYSVELPCSFMLVASMNPCPCGYYNHPTRHCTCLPGQIKKYLNKISGPLMDRIDIQVEVAPVPFSDLANAPTGESSAQIRERVIRARKIQEGRYQAHIGIHCNAQMTSSMLHQYASLTPKGSQLLQTAMTRLNLSARAYDRILKVSRTIADLEGSERIEPQHLAEAIGYRTLDREDWAEGGGW